MSFGPSVRNGLGIGLGPTATLATAFSQATLDFNFIDNLVFPTDITFTRASSATYFNSAGVLTTAGNNVPRLDYNPATLAPRGLLIEEQRTNLLLQSENFATSWVKDANSTLTVDTGVAPDGLIVADKLAVGTSTFPQTAQSVTSSASGTYTLSCFVKASGLNFVQLRLRNTSTPTNFFRAIFNLSTGAISAPSGGGTGTYSTGSAAFVGNGWWRLSITGVPDPGGGAAIQAVLILTFDATGAVATPSNSSATDGLLFFGAQIEAGAFPTSYIPTTTAAATRSADVASVNTLSPWFNATEGTLFAEGTVVNSISGTTPREYAEFGNAAGTDRIAVEARSATSTRARTVTGGVSVISSDTYDALGKNVKITGAYGSDGITVCVDGRAPITTASAIPMPNTLYLGANFSASAASVINGYLRRITYYPSRLSNAELQSITT